jgi:hypothetical protein|tara:strand:+ start:1040 stop:1984 length:945 start_codon:yes stop_codon:yes gene_type:complete
MKKRNTTKLTRAAIAMAAVASVTAQAEIELTEGFSLQGFLDVSASSSDVDGKDTKSTAEIGEFEVDFLYGGDSINAQVDLNYTDSSGGVDLEQAFVGFSVSDQFSLKAGKFLSCIGYESFDVNGLYQYSAAASTVYPGHHTGLAGVYSGDTFGVYGSVVDGTWSADGDTDNLGYEVQVFTSPAEGLTIKLGYATEDLETRDKAMLNLWAGYSVDSLTVAAEYSSLEDFDFNDDNVGDDGDAYMLMANYAFTETFNTTLRYAHVDADNAEIDEFTISPRFVISDSVSVITEYRHRDYDVGGADEDLLAARVLYTF